jgi:hypothetical protein
MHHTSNPRQNPSSHDISRRTIRIRAGNFKVDAPGDVVQAQLR